MREEEFRERLRGALGEPPPSLASPVLGRRAAAGARLYPRAMGLLAIAVAVLLIIVLAGSRVTLRPRGEVLPAATPSAAAQPAPDSMPCYLAVDAITEAANPGQQSASSSVMGFVNIPAGTFSVDPRATASDLPGGSSTAPNLYSAALHRWLPASTRTVSPDGRSYAYVRLMPVGSTYSDFTSSELHIVDASIKSDRRVWTDEGDIEIFSWRTSGILVSTVPAQGGLELFWLVDPATGAVTQQANASLDPNRPPPGVLGPNGGAYSYLGGDSAGRGVYRLGARDQGTRYDVIVVDGGKVTHIYSGTAGDATDFDPEGVFFDAHGLWMGNFDGSRMWLWTAAAGLRDYRVSGGAAAPAGYEFTSITYLPAGACVPGRFTGVAPSPLPPAATPSPSPVPSPVDWSPLLAKPVLLPDLAGGASCPVSSQVSLRVNARPGSGKWPNYGFGKGPAYVTGQVLWYSGGSQAMLVLVDPQYTGPVLVRTRRLDGAGSIAVTGDGSRLAGGAFGIPQSSSPPYWGTWIGSIVPSAPGCYGIQLDGTTFSDVVVIEVKQGPPPPG